MGGRARIRTLGDRPPLEALWHHIESCEQRWSRFDADSELTGLRAGAWTEVSAPTFGLLVRADRAWRSTGGVFDPTIGSLMWDRGYRGPLAEAKSMEYLATPGCWEEVELNAANRSVWIPPGVMLDMGGIAKGYTADLTAELALSLGADGVLVDMGGDIRVAGQAPPGGWQVSIELDGLGARCLTISLMEGAVATSSTRRRVWGVDRRHHLVDPRTGDQAASDLTSVAVVDAEAWQAETLATAICVAGSTELEGETSAVGLRDDGTLVSGGLFRGVDA